MDDERASGRALRLGLGIAVGIGWIISLYADIRLDSYQTPYAVHGLMGIVVGSVFADGNLLGLRDRVAKKLVPDPEEKK